MRWQAYRCLANLDQSSHVMMSAVRSEGYSYSMFLLRQGSLSALRIVVGYEVATPATSHILNELIGDRPQTMFCALKLPFAMQ